MIPLIFSGSAYGWEILPDSVKLCSYRKYSCPAIFPPKPQFSLAGTKPFTAWLAVQDVACSEIASQCVSAIDQRGALRWGVLPASPLRFTMSHSGLCSHLCEYTGIFLVYSANKIILSLILSIPIASRGHSPCDWGLSRVQFRPEASSFRKYRVQQTIWLIHDESEAHFRELAARDTSILYLALPFILHISSPKTDKPLAFIFPQAKV